MKIVYIDLETTGLDERDRICEIAILCDDKKLDDLCFSGKKISTEAMAFHHITNEMLSDKKSCDKTATFQRLQALNTSENILVSHHLHFDRQMLEKEGLSVAMQCIDTQRCVRSLIEECEQFSLQFLRYELGLYKDEKAYFKGEEVMPHRAFSDVVHVHILLEYLLEYVTLSKLIEISAKPVLLQKFMFGKYNGRYIEEIASVDRGYLHWILENIDDEDLHYSVGHYLAE